MSKATKRVWIERSRKRWRVRFRNGPGELQETAETVDTKREALQIKRRIEATIIRHAYAGKCLPLHVLADKYVTARVKEGGMSTGNAYSVTQAIDKIERETGWVSVIDITPQTLRRWRDTYASTGKWRHLRAVLNWSFIELDQPVDQRVLMRQNTTQKPNKPRRATLLTPEHLGTILSRSKALDVHVHVMVRLLAMYGMRPITLYRMQVHDVSVMEQMIHLRHTKNKAPYDIPIDEQLAKDLAEMVAGRSARSLLFVNPLTGRPFPLNKVETANTKWYPQHITYDFDQGLRGIYSLKDYAITRMVNAGIPDHEIILFTGHKTIDVLQRYKKSNMDRQRSLLDKIQL